MTFPKYEAYKDSGVEWLGEVPEHWEVCRITHHLQSVVDYRGRTPQKDESGVFLVTAKNIRNGFIDYEISQEFITEAAYQEVIQRGRPSVGDVVFTTEAPLGQVANLDRDDIALAQRVIKFNGIPRVVDNYFLKYWIMGNLCQSELESLATGSTALGIKGSKVNQLHFCLPSFSEQTQITRFLDHETARIDALIAEQERLIELLKEKRQAVISHAVTKGLDSTVPMKDSGVEWLGEVPEHWEIHLLRRAFRSVDYGISNSLNAEGNVAILRMGNIENGMIIKDDLKYVDSVPCELLLETGDLLYNRTNSLDQIGKVGLFYDDGSELQFGFASYLVRLRVNDQSTPEYFSYLLNTPAILDLARASAFVSIGQCNLNPARYGYIVVAMPPRDEQIQIVEYLDSKTSAIDELMSEANEGIQLLQERRSALISAAVTGKIDVRDWQPPASETPVTTLEAAYG